MTIHELLQAAGLTANDEIPIWDADGTGEPTKKITAQQLAAAVVTLANLVTSVNNQTGAVSITPANIGAAADSAAMQYRGYYPNGQSMLSLAPGYYRTTLWELPSETFPSGISTYGTLCVDNSDYRHITYISVLGDFMFWKSNGTGAWYVIQHEGCVPISAGGTGATTPAQARANLEITPANIGAVDADALTIKPWGVNGESILANNGIYARSYNQNILPSQGAPTGFSPYASALSVTGLGYPIVAYIDVFGNLAIWNSNQNKWGIYQQYGHVYGIEEGGTGATDAPGARANLGLNDIGTAQAQSAISLNPDNQIHQIIINKDCWVCASFHVTANTDGTIILLRNGIPVINNVNTNGPCNYWANAQFPCQANALLQYKLSSNAADSSIYFLTV